MEIPPETMKFDKEHGKQHAEINVLGIAYKPDGSVGARFSDTVKLDFADKKDVDIFKQHQYHYENQFDVATGKYDLKVVFSFGRRELRKSGSAASRRSLRWDGILVERACVQRRNSEVGAGGRECGNGAARGPHAADVRRIANRAVGRESLQER